MTGQFAVKLNKLKLILNFYVRRLSMQSVLKITLLVKLSMNLIVFSDSHHVRLTSYQILVRVGCKANIIVETLHYVLFQWHYCKFGKLCNNKVDDENNNIFPCRVVEIFLWFPKRPHNGWDYFFRFIFVCQRLQKGKLRYCQQKLKVDRIGSIIAINKLIL